MGVQVVVLSNYIAIILGKGRTCLNQVPQLRSGFSWCSTCSSHFTKTGTTLSNSCTMSWIDEVQRGHAQGNPSAWHEESKLRNVTRKGSAFCRRKQTCWPCSSPNISEFLIKSYAFFYKSSKIYKILQNLMKMHFRSFRFFSNSCCPATVLDDETQRQWILAEAAWDEPRCRRSQCFIVFSGTFHCVNCVNTVHLLTSMICNLWSSMIIYDHLWSSMADYALRVTACNSYLSQGQWFRRALEHAPLVVSSPAWPNANWCKSCSDTMFAMLCHATLHRQSMAVLRLAFFSSARFFLLRFCSSSFRPEFHDVRQWEALESSVGSRWQMHGSPSILISGNSISCHFMPFHSISCHFMPASLTSKNSSLLAMFNHMILIYVNLMNHQWYRTRRWRKFQK